MIRRTLPTRSTLLNAAGVRVMLGLATQVVYLKRLWAAEAAERAALTATIPISTREFLQGASLPALNVVDHEGRASTLSEMCRKGRTTVVS